jgi:hypothetical protein
MKPNILLMSSIVLLTMLFGASQVQTSIDQPPFIPLGTKLVLR